MENNEKDNKLEALEKLRLHIIETEKDNENYEQRLKDIEDKIKKHKEKQKWDKLKNNNAYNRYLGFIEKRAKNKSSTNNTPTNTNNKKEYEYDGPVYEFGKFIGSAKDINKNKESYKTHASSKSEAANNIRSKIKKDLNRTQNSKITIDENQLKEVK